MPPKKKLAKSTLPKKRPKISIPDDAQWCMDNSRLLTFRKFLEKFDCLDQRESEQRYNNILTKYVHNKCKERAKIEYNTWTKSADYKVFWNDRAELDIILQTNKQSTGFIGLVTGQRMKSLMDKANAVAQTTTSNTSTQEIAKDVTDDSEKTNNDAIPDSNTINDTTDDIDSHNNADGISSFDLKSCIDSSSEVCKDPWIFRGNNITRMFKDYQSIVQSLVRKHVALPLETYINELAALTHILVLNKNQHSSIAKKVFSVDLLDYLAVSLVSESMDYNLSMNDQQYMAMAKIINQLSLSNTTREKAFLELTLMSSRMNYSERRLIHGITNLIQKLPNLPLKDNSSISESELWSTYFDPLLSCLICDPEKLVHLRWTNAIPSEGGKLRPDAIISKRQQLEYEGSIGHGEVKINQGSSSRYLLCMDTLRLAIFNKNAIDVNKLDGALAFQIHGFYITFFISRLVKNGIYVFYEVANLRFPESFEDLPSFISLKNITLLLAVNDVFWRLCKKSDDTATITSRYKETVNLEGLTGTSQDRTRTCAMRYGQ
ncbi:hypothetical protein J3Q64DRAFT_1738072 [Phycomyces blakesleeanus]|uniref:Uncharacterized protein n=1 Tax=Phycomyces blakesleeanus TaxID=4837 RepID=A0ABR3B1Y8_PHYBL